MAVLSCLAVTKGLSYNLFSTYLAEIQHTPEMYDPS